MLNIHVIALLVFPALHAFARLIYNPQYLSEEIAVIPRYTRPEMARIWSDENRFRTWLAVEVAATETLAAAGIVPKEAAKAIRARAAGKIGPTAPATASISAMSPSTSVGSGPDPTRVTSAFAIPITREMSGGPVPVPTLGVTASG